MFQFIKKVFVRKPAEGAPPAHEQPAAPDPAAQAQYQGQAAEAPFRPRYANQPGAPAPMSPQARRQGLPDSNGNFVLLPLYTILNGLPLELRSRVRQPDVGEATLSIPLEKILPQLASGSVKIAFGELRRAAQQVFSSSGDCDQVQVSLPLHEILSRIDPAMLVRRGDQRIVTVSEEISSPFGDRGQGLIFTVGPNKGNAAPPAAAAPQRAAPPAAAAPQRAVTPQRVPPPSPIQPVQPAPIQQAPIQSAPFAPAPIQPAPIQASPIQMSSAQMSPFQPKPNPAGATQPKSTQPVPFQSKQVQPGPFQPNPFQQNQPGPFQQKPAAPAPIQPRPVPPSPFQPKPAAPGPFQPKPAPPAQIQPSPFQPAPVQPTAYQQPVFQPAPIQPAPAQPNPFQPNPFQPAPVPSQFQPAPVRSPIAPAPTAPSPGPAMNDTPEAIPLSPALRGLGASLTPAPAAPAPRQVISRIPNPAEPTGEGANVIVPLAALAEGWPEGVRQEIMQLNLGNAQVALPGTNIEDTLKRGKAAFPWKLLRSWIRPMPAQTVSVHDAVVLDLPLKVITPIFLARQKDGSRQQKIAVDENIPNLFFGFPQPEAAAPAAANVPGHPAAAPQASHAVAKPVDTNYYVWDDASDSAKVDETEFKKKPSPETSFITRYATPNEVVSRAAALDGVAGALIALPDGLMVASRLAPDLNGDTLAAFLPHIFGKVSQCTKELRMGELNNLNFTVGNVPWKIFRVNAIFFAAFGRVGQPLPTAQLAALAAELDHKKQ